MKKNNLNWLAFSAATLAFFLPLYDISSTYKSWWFDYYHLREVLFIAVLGISQIGFFIFKKYLSNYFSSKPYSGLLIGCLSLLLFVAYFFLRPNADYLEYDLPAATFYFVGGFFISLSVWNLMENVFSNFEKYFKSKFWQTTTLLAKGAGRVLGVVIILGFFSMTSSQSIIQLVLPGPIIFLVPLAYLYQVIFLLVAIVTISTRRLKNERKLPYLLLGTAIIYEVILIGALYLTWQVFQETFSFGLM